MCNLTITTSYEYLQRIFMTLAQEKMVLILAIVFSAMVLSFCLATSLIGYSIYMCFKLRKSLKKKEIFMKKEKMKYEETKFFQMKDSSTVAGIHEKCQAQKFPKENFELINNVAYESVSVRKDN